MGVLPGGSDDVNTADGLFLNAPGGAGTQSVSALESLDQSTVEGGYKDKMIDGGSSVWTNGGGPLGQLFGGLAGFPDVFGRLIGNMFGVMGPFPNIESVLNAVEQVPILGDFVQLAQDVFNGFRAIFNTWFGVSTGNGSHGQVAATVKSIRVLTKDGYTLQTFVASDPAWVVPPDLKVAEVAWAGVIGGGQPGYRGAGVINSVIAVAYGGEGGIDGGYQLKRFDASTLGETLAVVIGTASVVEGVHGTPSSIGDIVTSAPGVSGIEAPEGYAASTSKPGSGGRGGDSWNIQGATAQYPGRPGESSAVGAGGVGGSASGGGNGGTGTPDNLPACGGGGGGGGSGRDGFFSGGYPGGDGGYPGGGGGGGGGHTASSGPGNGGPGGDGANGFGFLIWKGGTVEEE